MLLLKFGSGGRKPALGDVHADGATGRVARWPWAGLAEPAGREGLAAVRVRPEADNGALLEAVSSTAFSTSTEPIGEGQRWTQYWSLPSDPSSHVTRFGGDPYAYFSKAPNSFLSNASFGSI